MDGVWFYGAGCYFLTRRVWGGEIRGLERERERERVLGWGGVSSAYLFSWNSE